MSLSKLPVELKRLVVHHAHQGDLNYRRRHEMREKDGEETRRVEERGKSVYALSSVTKEWRSLAVEVLFTTLHSSKAKGPFFDRFIRGTTLADNFTTLVIEPTESLDRLSALAFRILPLFRNIREVSTTHRHILDKPPLAPRHTGSVAISDERLISNEFEKYAKDRLTGWKARLDAGWQYGPIVFANLHTLRSLSIETRPLRRIPLLETFDSEFARLLSQCTSLETLKLITTMPLETAFDHPLVHDHTLSLEFASASVLRSLDLIFKGIHLDLSFASFAEKFSSLQALRISGLNINFDQSGTGRIVLPELKHLDIFEVDTLLVAFVILDEFSAPKLDRLDIKVNSDHRFISSPDEHAEWLVDLSDTLEKFGLPASSCYLHDPIGAGKIEVEDYLPGIHYDWDIGAFEASYISWCSDPRKEWVSEMEPRGEEEVTEALTTAIDDLADWAKEEARTLTIADDWVGLEELWQQLRDVNELKKYKED